MRCLLDDNMCDKANTFADCSGCTIHGLETFPDPLNRKLYTEYLNKKYGGQRKVRPERRKKHDLVAAINTLNFLPDG